LRRILYRLCLENGTERFARRKTLSPDYTEEAILERISGKRIVVPKQKTYKQDKRQGSPAVETDPIPTKPNLMIDIQMKLQQGYGEGYRNWAVRFNLKEASKTLIYLQEKGIVNYDDLSQKTAAASGAYHAFSGRIKAVEKRMNEIKELQSHITSYKRTLDVYRGYRNSNWSRKYYAAHDSDIIIHKAAKKYFDELGMTKLPPMDSLKQEYAKLAAESKKLYGGYKHAREEMISLQKAKQNADMILGEPKKPSKNR